MLHTCTSRFTWLLLGSVQGSAQMTYISCVNNEFCRHQTEEKKKKKRKKEKKKKKKRKRRRKEKEEGKKEKRKKGKEEEKQEEEEKNVPLLYTTPTHSPPCPKDNPERRPNPNSPSQPPAPQEAASRAIEARNWRAELFFFFSSVALHHHRHQHHQQKPTKARATPKQ